MAKIRIEKVTEEHEIPIECPWCHTRWIEVVKKLETKVVKCYSCKREIRIVVETNDE